MTHLALMALYALVVSVFFALLARRTVRGRLRLGAAIFFGLLLGALVLGWLMAPFPSGPPAPIP